MRSLLAVLAVGLVTLVPAGRAHSGCTTTKDASTAKRSLARQVSCNDKRLRKGPSATCNLVAPPACAPRPSAMPRRVHTLG